MKKEKRMRWEGRESLAAATDASAGLHTKSDVVENKNK
jgi:hypothetical protein